MLQRKEEYFMPDKKCKSKKSEKKEKQPSVTNDQLGENAGEGRYERYEQKKH